MKFIKSLLVLWFYLHAIFQILYYGLVNINSLSSLNYTTHYVNALTTHRICTCTRQTINILVYQLELLILSFQYLKK